MRATGLALLAAVLLLSTACPSQRQSPVNETVRQETMNRKDINDVLREHDDELLAIPGVVGVYVGVLADDKTPCLKIMVVKKSEDLEKAIPKTIDGYPVEIEETGIIRPLTDK